MSGLKPELLEQACERAQVVLRMRFHDGYDHSSYFIAIFIDHHLRHHAAALADS
jgi:S-formylglutathione hydrolase